MNASPPKDNPRDPADTATRFILEIEGRQVTLAPEEIVSMVETGSIALDTLISLTGSSRKAPLRRWIRELVFAADEQNRSEGLSEAPYRSLFEVAFDDAPIGMVLSDLSGRIVRSNRAAADFLGRSARDLVGRAVGELSYGKSRQDEILLGNELVAGKIKSFQVEKQFIHPSGAVLDAIVGLSILRSTENRSARVIAHITDIREQKKLEKTAAEAGKHRAISNFAGSLAHDLNNLLSTIILNTGQAREAPHKVGDSLDGIDLAVAAAERLIGQLQSLHSSVAIEVQPLDLDKAIIESVPLLTSLIPTTAVLDTSLACEALQALVNPSQFEQVLLNLVVNAGHALRDGVGTVNIRTRKVDSSPAQKREAMLLVEVEDTGTGMSKELIDKIFLPFFSTRKQAGGTGLGLSTVVNVVAQTGGSIDVSSVPNEGSVFRLQWPIFDPSRHAAHARDPDRDSLQGLRVLVVDDQPDIVRILRRLLTRERCEIVTASSVHHGRERLRDDGPFDVILAGVILDDGGGTELYEFATKEEFGGNFVFMSGFGDTDIAEAIGTTDYGFLHKPFVPSDVHRVLLEASGHS